MVTLAAGRAGAWLWIGVVESHGGQVVLFSQVGAGSTFILWFPDRSRAQLEAAPDSNPLTVL